MCKDRCKNKLYKSKYDNSLRKDKFQGKIAIRKSVGNNRSEKNQILVWIDNKTNY